jgi:selenocysteine-specific elongation factor
MALAAGRIVSRSALRGVESSLLEEVASYHRDHPLEPGIPTQLLRTRLRAAPEIVEFVMGAQLSSGALGSGSGSVWLGGWSPNPSREQAAQIRSLLQRLDAAGAEPPGVDELAAEFGEDIGPFLRFLERRSEVTQVEQNRYYATAQLRQLVDRLRDAMPAGKELSPSELRETLGLSRKFLIPFLEYCDRAGYTNRGVTGRVWRIT